MQCEILTLSVPLGFCLSNVVLPIFTFKTYIFKSFKKKFDLVNIFVFIVLCCDSPSKRPSIMSKPTSWYHIYNPQTLIILGKKRSCDIIDNLGATKDWLNSLIFWHPWAIISKRFNISKNILKYHPTYKDPMTLYYRYVYHPKL